MNELHRWQTSTKRFLLGCSNISVMTGNLQENARIQTSSKENVKDTLNLKWKTTAYQRTIGEIYATNNRINSCDVITFSIVTTQNTETSTNLKVVLILPFIQQLFMQVTFKPTFHFILQLIKTFCIGFKLLKYS